MKKLFLVLFLLSITSISFAHKYFFITPSGNGWKNGKDWNNAWSPTELAANWSKVQDSVNASGGGNNVYILFSGGTSGSSATYNLTSTNKIIIGASGKSGSYLILAGASIAPYPYYLYHNGTPIIKENLGNNIVNIIYAVNKNYLQIRGLTFQDVTGTSARELYINNGENINIETCTFSAPDNSNIDNIQLVNCRNVTISNCNIKATGSSGIGIHQSSSVTIENNNIYTQTIWNNNQIDCIKIGGLGENANMSGNEYTIIRNNIIKNNAINKDTVINGIQHEGTHDDCIQFYTRADTNQKFYYGYDATHQQIVHIYGNYIEQTAIDDPENTGIIINGCEGSSCPNNAGYREGYYTQWYIWSNIFRKEKGNGLIDINRMNPEAIFITNNTFYTENYSTVSEGHQLIIYNPYTTSLRNTKILNNIFSAGYSYPLVKYGNSDIPISFGTGTLINYNDYFPNSTSSSQIILSVSASGTLQNLTLAQWRSAPYSSDSNGSQSNPLFMATIPEDANDFQITQGESYCSGSATTNFGATWTDWNEDYDGDTRGTASLGNWDIGAWEQNDEAAVPPKNISLKYNITAYPNPFNPNTSIQYSIPKESKVTLIVYDILGNVISELVNEYQMAGRYTINFNGENLSSGIYFYVLRSENYIDTNKMILMK